MKGTVIRSADSGPSGLTKIVVGLLLCLLALKSMEGNLVMFVLLSLSSAMMVLSNENIVSNVIQFPPFKLIPQLITTPLKVVYK